MILKYVMTGFAILGLLDRLLGGRLGLGKAFEKGFSFIGALSLSMIGMIVIAPVIADLLSPLFAKAQYIDPSLWTSMLFANDMGGAPLAQLMCKDEKLGLFNGLVTASMMGCTLSFTIPVGLGMVSKERSRALNIGLMCGIVTIPIGCIPAGLISGLTLTEVLVDMLPIIAMSALIAVGLIKKTRLTLGIFKTFGTFISVLICIGLGLGILDYMAGIRPLDGIGSLEEGFIVVFNAALVLSGAFPLLTVLEKILKPLLKRLGGMLGINESSALGFLSTLATNLPTLEKLNDMDEKGAVLNGAFMVSSAFVLADHLAFTLSFDSEYVFAVMLGKLISGVFAVAAAYVLYPKVSKLS